MPTIGSVAAGQTAVMTPPRRRVVVTTLLFVTVVINQLDRGKGLNQTTWSQGQLIRPPSLALP